MAVVQDAEQRFFPSLHALAAEINERFQNVRATVWSYPVGSLTEFQGHSLGVDCVITDARSDQPDNIALEIGFRRLTTSPYLDAGVCWGHPSGYSEADAFPDPVALTEDGLATVEAALPHLAAALVEALVRGQPPLGTGSPE
jgi:hypothetical protein